MANKWEVKSHSNQIGYTGDYDGWHELTNGIISLGTKDDDEETVEVLNGLVGHLNAWDIDLFDHTADNLAIDMHCLEEQWKSKYDELKAENETLKSKLSQFHDERIEYTTLKAKAQKMVDALENIQNGAIPAIEKEAWTWIEVARRLANDAISNWNSNEEKEGV